MRQTVRSILCVGLSAAMLAATPFVVPTSAKAETVYGADGSYQIADNGRHYGQRKQQDWRRYGGNRHWNNGGYAYQPRPGYAYRPRPGYAYRGPAYHPGWRGPGYYVRPGYSGRYYYNDYNAALAAGVFGLATGAIIAGAVSQPRYTYGNGYGGSYEAYCSQRYRSFNPATGTYTGYDGLQHRCIAP